MFCVAFFSEPIEVGYEVTEYVTSEGVGFIELCAVVSSHPTGSQRPFTMAVTIEDGVASTIFMCTK